MGAVSYGQAGYVGTSMSVRARAAYESGEMPMSKWTRGAIISAIKDYCDDFDLAYDSKIESMTRAQLAEGNLENMVLAPYGAVRTRDRVFRIG